jgi:hypothetical protein
VELDLGEEERKEKSEKEKIYGCNKTNFRAVYNINH